MNMYRRFFYENMKKKLNNHLKNIGIVKWKDLKNLGISSYYIKFECKISRHRQGQTSRLGLRRALHP